MKRTCFGRGAFGPRVTPDDIRTCFRFLARAAALVRTPGPERARVTWVPGRLSGRPAAAFRRRP